ncbi:MAG: HAMP domain-containing histidine kinase [Elusimicrobia bacterium]|nr:HAMP domain-containing histidine kinase [Elusimicrobiota bacterium]
MLLIDLRTYITCFLVMIGAVIMLFSILKFRKTLSLVKSIQTKGNEYISLFVRIHTVLMIFFLVGYVVVIYAFCRNLHIISESFIGIIFFLGAIFVFLGISIQDTLIARVRKHISTVSQMEKMVALGQLAGGVAHELKNPISVILGFAQSLKKVTVDNSSLKMPIESIEREAERSKELISNLLVFSRKEKIETEEIDLNKTIDDAIVLVQSQTKVSDIKLIKNYGDLPKFTGNKNKILQLIINLCNNAIDAMPRGGELTVSTSLIANNKSPGTTSDKPQAISIQITDTGMGIPEEIKKHIFEPFYTTKEEGKGTGLGLGLCYEIVKKHNGTIEVDSKPGKGTTFIIKFFR